MPSERGRRRPACSPALAKAAVFMNPSGMVSPGLACRLPHPGRIRKAAVFAALSVLLLSCASGGPQEPVEARHGVLDLRGHDVAKRAAALSGEWEFHWDRLLAPEDFRGAGLPASSFAAVPGMWEGAALRGRTRPQGFATYRLTVLLDRTPEPLALRIRTVSSAFLLFADGRPVAAAGTVGTTAAASVPAYGPQVVPLPEAEGRLELVLQVSNFHYRTGGVWRPLWIGSYRELSALHQGRAALGMLAAGAVLFMGLYFLVFFSFRRKDAFALFFSLFCLSVAVRALNTGEYMLTRLFPGIPFGAVIRMEYVSLLAAVPLIAMFLHALFPRSCPPWVRRPILGVAALWILAILCAPVRVFTAWMPAVTFSMYAGILVLLFVAVHALRKRGQGAAIVLIGFVILAAASVNDSLNSLRILQTGTMIDSAVILFSLLQAVMLSRWTTAAFADVEVLSAKLKTLNDTLEQQVRDRTGQLEKAYADIKRISITDSLTGSYNRAYLGEQFPRELERSCRYGHPLAVIMCDLDHFKRVNDTHGHLAGDRVLADFVGIIGASIRADIDWVCRYGGEEFLIVLPETDLAHAEAVAQRVRSKTEAHAVSAGDDSFSFTASFGVTGFSPRAGQPAPDQNALFQAADIQLYRAKNEGRNRVRSVAFPI